MRHDFTPRRVGEILDDAIALIKSNIRTIGPVTAVVVLPVAAAYSVVASFYMRTFLESFGAGFLGGPLPPGAAEPDAMFVVIMLLMQALALLYWVARALLEATVYANSAQLLERSRVPLREALKGGLRSFLMVIVMQMISGAASTAVLMVVVFAGILLSVLVMMANEAIGLFGLAAAYAIGLAGWAVIAVLFSLVNPVVVIEGGVGAAILRSVRLVRRHFWRVVLIMLASALLVAQFESALAAPTIVREIFMGVQSPGAVFREIAWGWKVFDGLFQGLAISFVLPFAAAVTLLTYLDVRARDEGMDLVIRARELLPE